MSSKYSEFRKNKQNVKENLLVSNNELKNQFNLEEIDQMMQVLAVTLTLGPKQSSMGGRR